VKSVHYEVMIEPKASALSTHCRQARPLLYYYLSKLIHLKLIHLKLIHLKLILKLIWSLLLE